MNERHELLLYFGYSHLFEYLKEVSRPFYELAEMVDETLPGGSEKDACLRKLLEAKDCAVRAAL